MRGAYLEGLVIVGDVLLAVDPRGANSIVVEMY
jgi:hypothetical protein